MNRQKDPHRYDDIISLPHHVSTRHPQMSRHDRAAQFSPFKAMVGYEDCVSTASRVTEAFRELSQDAREELDYKLSQLEALPEKHPVLTVEYFRPDPVKEGGKYISLTAPLRSINRQRHCLELAPDISIDFRMIRNMDLA